MECGGYFSGVSIDSKRVRVAHTTMWKLGHEEKSSAMVIQEQQILRQVYFVKTHSPFLYKKTFSYAVIGL